MDLTVDGYIYEWQRRGGISRIFTEVLPRVCDYEPSATIVLITENPTVQSLPAHARIIRRRIPRVENYLRPRRVWKGVIPGAQRWLRRRYLGSGKGAIWHSTYFREPDTWKGKRVVSVYDLAHEKFADLFNKPDDDRQRIAMRRSVQNADVVLTISRSSRNDISGRYDTPLEKIRVAAPACSDSFRFLPELSEAERRPFLLYVGDRNHYKNFSTFLEAYGRWPQAKNVDLIAVGGGEWLPNEVAQLQRLSLEKSVRRLAGLEDEGLAAVYNQALAFVYPSLYEGFGIPLLEALSCGCLVVASRIPSTLEVASDCPIYFEPKEADSLVAALDQALVETGNEARRERGFQQARRYSWESTARETLAVYRSLDAEMHGG